jgi:pimeloyl-ACP methyl ester carboxylesterase
MDHRHALGIVDNMKSGVVAVVKDSGHHLYLDNPIPFNNAILDALKHLPERNVESVEYFFKK